MGKYLDFGQDTPLSTPWFFRISEGTLENGATAVGKRAIFMPEEQEESSTEEPMPEEGFSHVDFNLLDVEGRWLLKVLSGPNSGAEFVMHGGSSYVIGTDPQQCDILFQDLSVSRRHARLSIDPKEIVVIEDLGSRNGTFVDGKRTDKSPIGGNSLVAMGTTTFLLIDREAERTTIVAPSSQEAKANAEEMAQSSKEKETTEEAGIPEPIQEAVLPPLRSEVDRVKEEERQQAKISDAVHSLITLAIVTAIVLSVGIGATFLFRTEEVVAPMTINAEDQIATALREFPAVRYSYNPSNNRLMLVGHVLTTADRSKLLDTLQQLKFVRDIDSSNVVIDELVRQEINQVLAKNPAWQGITITSPAAGRYILTGFLRSRDQAKELFDYVSQNFAYVDLLERRVVVEEELIGQINRELNESGFRGVTPSLVGGDLALRGVIAEGTQERFQKTVALFRSLPGIRNVQLFVSEGKKKESFVDLTEKYQVTGYSTYGNKVSVVIKGKILAPGDTLDGMLITSISPSTVFLEKDGVTFKIDFNR